MDFKDYYQTLGVPPEADEKAIRQAFRDLARKHHPDVNPGNKEAEEKFKSINEAYQALSDVKKRKKYDELREQYLQWQKTGDRQPDFNWNNWSTEGGKDPNVQYANAEDLEDLFGSSSPYSDFFTNIFGQQGGRSQKSSRARGTGSRRGRDIEYEIDVTLEEAFHGAERLLEMDGHRIQASIPAGVRTGTRVRLAGRGEAGLNGGTSGDLYLITKVLPNATFERAGDDLHLDVPVDLFTAIAGGEIRIPAMERPLLLTIPPCTNSNRSFRLRGKGMPHLGDPKQRGDLFARVRLVLPENLSDEEINSIRELASARQKDASSKP
jgi:curved DNA-binding protein